MDYSRRDLALLIPVLAAAAAETPALPTKAYAYDELPVSQRPQQISRSP